MKMSEITVNIASASGVFATTCRSGLVPRHAPVWNFCADFSDVYFPGRGVTLFNHGILIRHMTGVQRSQEIIVKFQHL